LLSIDEDGCVKRRGNAVLAVKVGRPWPGSSLAIVTNVAQSGVESIG